MPWEDGWPGDPYQGFQVYLGYLLSEADPRPLAIRIESWPAYVGLEAALRANQSPLPPATIAAALLSTSRRLISLIVFSSLPKARSRRGRSPLRSPRRTAQLFRLAHQAPSSPTIPRRNASTQTTKIAPVITVTH